jgi:hypothetical protein
MRGLVEILVIAGIFFSAFFFSAATGVAKPEYARRTKKECSCCHPADSWNLNDAGKYYRDHKYSLQGYVPPAPGQVRRQAGQELTAHSSGMNLLFPFQHSDKLLDLPGASLRFFHCLNAPQDRKPVRPVKSF